MDNSFTIYTSLQVLISLRQYAGTYYRLLFQIVFAFMGSVSPIPIAFAALILADLCSERY
jgi:hypothetical protein